MTKFVKGFVVCFCLFAGKFDGEHLMQIVDSIQPKLFAMVLEKVVIPESQKVSGPTYREEDHSCGYYQAPHRDAIHAGRALRQPMDTPPSLSD